MPIKQWLYHDAVECLPRNATEELTDVSCQPVCSDLTTSLAHRYCFCSTYQWPTVAWGRRMQAVGPHVGSGVEIIGLCCFLAGRHNRRLNQALFVLTLIQVSWLSVFCAVH